MSSIDNFSDIDEYPAADFADFVEVDNREKVNNV